MRFYCTLTGPIGGLNCEVLLYFNSNPIKIPSNIQHHIYQTSIKGIEMFSWIRDDHTAIHFYVKYNIMCVHVRVGVFVGVSMGVWADKVEMNDST